MFPLPGLSSRWRRLSTRRSRIASVGAVVSFIVLLFPLVLSAQEIGAGTAAAPSPPHFGLWSILPPIVAIGLALLFRDVVVALFTAVWTGAFLVEYFAQGSGFLWSPVRALGRTLDRFVLDAIIDADHAAILVFSGLLGAMVAVIGRSGGAVGVVERLRPFATNRRRGQLATWFMGIAVFFDDYANTLIVGPTMRPITDNLRISREKLAYIVDSTAAPIVSLVPISTWIGFEIGMVEDGLRVAGLDRDAFLTIVASIPFRFYQILALVLGLMIAMRGLDFGAMLRAERRAVERGELMARDAKPLADFESDGFEPEDDVTARARNAILPILTVVVLTVIGLWTTGSSGLETEAIGLGRIRDVIANGASTTALLWASLGGVMVAAGLAIGQRLLSLEQTTQAVVSGIKAMMTAFVVLILAWALGDVCGAIGTGPYLQQVTEGNLAPGLLPTVVFVLAAATAFATGTSWGTMGILTPLVIPLAHGLVISSGGAVGQGNYEAVLLGTVAAVLAGSVWGDHCSPISDTTILSSMASGCDHLAHVRTQIPYAMLAGTMAIALGFLPTGFGLAWWIALPLGLIAIVGTILLAGKSAEETT